MILNLFSHEEAAIFPQRIGNVNLDLDLPSLYAVLLCAMLNTLFTIMLFLKMLHLRSLFYSVRNKVEEEFHFQ